MNRTVKMQPSTIRVLPTKSISASASKYEPALYAYENDAIVASWSCTPDGFLQAFAFMCRDGFRR